MNILKKSPPVNGAESEDVLSALRNEVAALREEVSALRRELSEPDPELIDVSTAAECLSVSERTLRSYLSDETIRSVKVGRRRLVPPSALRSFVEARLDA